MRLEGWSTEHRAWGNTAGSRKTRGDGETGTRRWGEKKPEGGGRRLENRNAPARLAWLAWWRAGDLKDLNVFFPEP